MSDTFARISRIQKFCTHDGPGVRTTVFFKGCPLRCAWCHNPETRSSKPGILFSEKLCVFCGNCEIACSEAVHSINNKHHIRLEKCLGCGRCASVCPTGALEPDSTLMSTETILAEVLRDRVFYGANGGITLSGGEPMFQPEACLSLLRSAKESNITTAIETCGFFEPEYIPELAKVTDTFLWDFKDSDPERHRKYTGHSNHRILDNLRILDEYPANIHLRCIMVDGVNMTREHALAIAELSASLKHCRDVELLPYHAYGISKATQAGIAMEAHREWIPSPERMQEFSDLLAQAGAKLHKR